MITYERTKTSIVKAYHRYRSYYDRKANAKPQQLHNNCLILNPILTTQNDLGAKAHKIWLPLYRIEMFFTSSNYIIRKMGPSLLNAFTGCAKNWLYTEDLKLPLRTSNLLIRKNSARILHYQNLDWNPSILTSTLEVALTNPS